MDWPAVIAAFRAHALPDRDADDHLAHQRDAREGALRPYNVRALRASAPGDKAQLRADEAPGGARRPARRRPDRSARFDPKGQLAPAPDRPYLGYQRGAGAMPMTRSFVAPVLLATLLAASAAQAQAPGQIPGTLRRRPPSYRRRRRSRPRRCPRRSRRCRPRLTACRAASPLRSCAAARARSA